ALELGQPLQNAMQARSFRAGIRTAQSPHDGLFVIRLLVPEVDLRIESAGKIRWQVAGILRADRDAGTEGAALAGKVFEMLAMRNARSLVEHQEPGELARLGAAHQNAVQPDDNQLG